MSRGKRQKEVNEAMHKLMLQRGCTNPAAFEQGFQSLAARCAETGVLPDLEERIEQMLVLAEEAERWGNLYIGDGTWIDRWARKNLKIRYDQVLLSWVEYMEGLNEEMLRALAASGPRALRLRLAFRSHSRSRRPCLDAP